MVILFIKLLIKIFKKSLNGGKHISADLGIDLYNIENFYKK